MRQIILATGNAHKAQEFQGLFAGTELEICAASVCGGMPDVEETGKTFVANAKLKAMALRELAPKDAWVLADDSGLSVDFLRGGPGVYSARYAGCDATDADNVEKLLWVMRGVPMAQRAARFRCALCLIDEVGELRVFEGHCEGHILEAPRGDAGFGYDPVFQPLGYSESFGELGEEVKSRLSHRAKAIEALQSWLPV
ncbi:RdgB/HAM1 family non-canonical purine NTP pyrophosphatase [Coraliomargarita parva]|uniref:RdgB/HAM1 family non-canonical purine NTP pyrophosphatase n=1 Tax=Coraliomargarita parva TaxID=3014050 RepID=UPI0022B50FD9|nr:RdgB/HAM1 family non-canonical purine NTP pyrophosphatase [Coraliomargarita parva]